MVVVAVMWWCVVTAVVRPKEFILYIGLVKLSEIWPTSFVERERTDGALAKNASAGKPKERTPRRSTKRC